MIVYLKSKRLEFMSVNSFMASQSSTKMAPLLKEEAMLMTSVLTRALS